MVEDAVNAGYPVGMADIKYANGADNALLYILEQKNLLFKLKTYSGWNTATNSTGFALGTGMLAGKMIDAAKDHLLAVRCLDDDIEDETGSRCVLRAGLHAYGGGNCPKIGYYASVRSDFQGHRWRPAVFR